MFHATVFLLIGTALLLGLRHGIDWDHIAAITDITGASEGIKKSLFLGTAYALGHGFVIVSLGLLAVLIGVKLPGWVDSVMQPVVGITLILLGIYLAFSVVRHLRSGHTLKMRSRWMLIFEMAGKTYNYIEKKVTHRHTHSHFQYPRDFSLRIAFFVGILHGIGAETPTQLLLFVTAAGTGGGFLGSILVFVFVIGLIISNTFITILSILGYTEAAHNQRIYLFLASFTSLFSLTVGFLFLSGRAATLPAILGG